MRSMRLVRMDFSAPPDPLSPEYLYLVQQSKRVSITRTLNAFGKDNLTMWPYLIAVALAKWLDLALSNTLIRSLINERDLLNRANSRPQEERF